MAVDVVSVPARNRSLAAFRRLNSDNDTKHKIEQILRNVLTYTTKHKEQRNKALSTESLRQV